MIDGLIPILAVAFFVTILRVIESLWYEQAEKLINIGLLIIERISGSVLYLFFGRKKVNLYEEIYHSQLVERTYSLDETGYVARFNYPIPVKEAVEITAERLGLSLLKEGYVDVSTTVLNYDREIQIRLNILTAMNSSLKEQNKQSLKDTVIKYEDLHKHFRPHRSF